MDTRNLQSWLSFLCSPAVTEASCGVIAPLTPEQAAGFIGAIVVETGSPDLSDLDVVEAGCGAGRGAMQYTGVRRGPYDKARSEAIARGLDPNSPAWQQRYFAEEYAGLHDPPEGSLIGWTQVFALCPVELTPEQAAIYWTGSAEAAQGYFRPGRPQSERRQVEAARIWALIEVGTLCLPQDPASRLALHVS